MKQVTVYHKGTGHVLKLLTVNNEVDLRSKIHVPEDHAWVEGHVDPDTQKINVVTGEPELYTPEPAPHDPVQRRRTMQRTIEQIEAAQHRAVRELMLDPSNAEARQRLAAIDAEIAQHRARLT